MTLSLSDYFREPPVRNFGRPFPGDLIEGTGGAIKYRYALERSDEGKSGSYRIIYLVVARGTVYFIDVYGKHAQASLSNREKHDLRKSSRELRQ